MAGGSESSGEWIRWSRDGSGGKGAKGPKVGVGQSSSKIDIRQYRSSASFIWQSR